MTIEQENVVDFVGLDEKHGFVFLTISDHLPWVNNDSKLLVLQNKINTYLAFLESGEIYLHYPLARSLNPVINLVSKIPANQKDIKFLNKVRAIVEEAGFSFQWSVLGSGSEKTV